MLLPPCYPQIHAVKSRYLWWAEILALSLWKEGDMTHDDHKIKRKQQLRRSPAILGLEDWETFFPWACIKMTRRNVLNYVPKNIHTINLILLFTGCCHIELFFFFFFFNVGQWYNNGAQFIKSSNTGAKMKNTRQGSILQVETIFS